MTRINIPEPDPIVIDLEGKKFKVSKITNKMTSAVQEASERGENIAKQVSILLGCKVSEVEGMDVRTLSQFMTQFYDLILGATSPPENAEKS